MSSNHVKSGPNNVGAYQMSGIPFVTSSAPTEVKGIDNHGGQASPEPICVKFPFVTKYVTIRNTGINELRVGFTKLGMFEPGERMSTSLGGDVKGNISNVHTKNFFLIPTGSGGEHSNGSAQSIITFDVRCKEIYFHSNGVGADGSASAVSTGFCLLAGLTTIKSDQFPTLTGSIDGVTAFEGVG